MKTKKATILPAYTNELFVITGLSVTIFLIRSLWSSDWYFWFLLWNTFLAGIPLMLSQIIRRMRADNVTLPIFFLAMGWMVFFPNAPYLITDLFHLHERTTAPLWLDTFMLFLFALEGLALTLSTWSDIIIWLKKICRPSYQLGLKIGILFLTSLGLYIGRYLRWNSWDILFQPWRILHETLIIIRHPVTIIDFLGFTAVTTLMLGALLIALQPTTLSPKKPLSRL